MYRPIGRTFEKDLSPALMHDYPFQHTNRRHLPRPALLSVRVSPARQPPGSLRLAARKRGRDDSVLRHTLAQSARRHRPQNLRQARDARHATIVKELDHSPLGPATLVISATSPSSGRTLFIEGFDIDGELIMTGVARNIEGVVGDTTRVSISLQLVGSEKFNGNSGNP